MARPPKPKLAAKIKEIDEALDRATSQFLINTQSKLSAASPVKTGRLASSWNIGRNAPDLSVPPPRKKREKITIKSWGGKITYGGDWFISSNLDYTFLAAFIPYNGRRGAGAWFTTIENGLSKDADRIFTRELSKVS